MTPPNYCRQILTHGLDMDDSRGLDAGVAWGYYKELLTSAKKFVLPSDSYWFETDVSDLDDGAELRLPFPCIALELFASNPEYERMVVAALEVGNSIHIEVFVPGLDRAWVWLYAVRILRVGWRESRGVETTVKAQRPELPEEWLRWGTTAVLGLLNALSCSNVHVEQLEARKVARKAKAALPFDAYHVLTVEVGRGGERAGTSADRRSPREHFRRGHKRRLADGRQMWINATVVAAGPGSGFIDKAYRVKPRP